MLQNITPFTPKDFVCDICDFKCSKKSDWDRHILSSKHKCYNKCYKQNADKEFLCDSCNKKYKSRMGIWRHKKICDDTIVQTENKDFDENIVIENKDFDENSLDSSNNEFKLLTNLVLDVVKSNTELQKQYIDVQKQNHELHKQILDVCKNSNNIISNNTVNSHNKTFNLQVFLNEECKDAMNLKDFVNSFKLQLSDLELVGDEGFINGMTKVILAKLDGMDANTRPFHCTDLKRETVYVKEDDVWVREGPDNAKLAAAIKAIGHQNFFILKEYKALHPDCESTYSEFNDHYMNLIMKSAGCQKEDIAKVIKKLVKEIVIVK